MVGRDAPRHSGTTGEEGRQGREEGQGCSGRGEGFDGRRGAGDGIRVRGEDEHGVGGEPARASDAGVRRLGRQCASGEHVEADGRVAEGGEEFRFGGVAGARAPVSGRALELLPA